LFRRDGLNGDERGTPQHILQGHIIQKLIDAVLDFQERGSDVTVFPLHAGITVFLVRAIHDAEGAFQAFEHVGNRDLSGIFTE
jgi:hypothetical protein